MNILQAKIIIKKRKECDARLARKGGCAGRCSICPLWTTLDDYIIALEVVEQDEERKRNERSVSRETY